MGRFPTTLSLFLPFLIILLHTNILIAYSALPLVLDSNGDYLQTGVNYYIQPLSAGRTIGLSSAPPNGTCPLDPVLQTDKNALPVTFSLVNSEDNSAITTEIDTNIIFSASTICVTSTVWRIQPSTNGTTTTYFVTTGGVKGNPGSGTVSNWFKIEGSANGYFFYFCPTVCNTCRPVCGNIGLILENGRTRLGITSLPLQVKFVRTGF